MQLQRLIWLDVTRPERRELLRSRSRRRSATASAGSCWDAGGVRRGGAGGDVRPQVRDAGVGGDHPASAGRGPAHQLAVLAAHRRLRSVGIRQPVIDHLASTSGYPGGMLAFILKKFVESYLALRAVSRVHWPSVYACWTRSAASSLVKFT